MSKVIVHTEHAPKAIGTYSQAVRVGDLVFLSGQIPLDPDTMALVSDDIKAQATQVFTNIQAVAEAAGGSLSDVVKLNIYLTDLNHFATVNEVMTGFFSSPFPARAVVGVASLPRNSLIEAEAICSIPLAQSP